MLRPLKLLTGLLACCFFFLTCILISSPSSTRSNPYYTRNSCPHSSSSSSLSSPQQQQQYQQRPELSRPDLSLNDLIPAKVIHQVRPSQITTTAPIHPSLSSSSTSGSYGARTVETDDDPRYLMYIPYAGVTNQLISIWHGSLIAKALNRTLLIPNLSPNVHVDNHQDQDQEPAATKWSEFFDLEHYSKMTGLKIEELDSFLAKRGIVEKTTRRGMAKLVDHQGEEGSSSVASESASSSLKRRNMKRSEGGQDSSPYTSASVGAGAEGQKKRHRKRWIQLDSFIQEGRTIPTESPLSSSASTLSSSSSSESLSTLKNKKKTIRSIKFPAVQKCFSEAGYGTDRRIDMTGRQFMQRYNIDPTLIPTPYLNPDKDNNSIWTRWRMDKVVERYQQPEFEQQEILCLGHVYRLLPGGHNRAWVEFGQHFQYTDRVHAFVDEILEMLLLSKKTTDQENNDIDIDIVAPSTTTPNTQRPALPFVGVHLRRGDFQRHCLGITSPADPNGWNRCYPSTEHIISLLNRHNHHEVDKRSQQEEQQQQSILASSSDANENSRPTHSHAEGLYHKDQQLEQDLVVPSSSFNTLKNNNQKMNIKNEERLPVLVLTNERDPVELAKADAQNWIRVDHQTLGTLDRFGRYGPILIDGALLARARTLVGVEYSTYFRTASRRAETWFGGQTIFVT
ncbi:hypothetical protein BGX28_005860 [Mortierella sp. GBA30]|nr:hypothetical protein BGX28_005860 [Mortierella sp. GBA30]